MIVNNIFENLSDLDLSDEYIEKIFEGENVYVERIVSKAHCTKPGEWLKQELNEWVIVLSGRAVLSFEGEPDVKLKSGDYIFIPAHKLHRVKETSSEPNCVWLTFFFK
ncbi:MAG: cupin domain-containing protein [Ignavibacteriaceae bacterium]|jgi:Cupin domain.|nr:MAG: cupin domain-containing protein [Chlorobiota bacterium]KXK06251.1 MAG: lipid A 3-O-deacylase [Chlorobi bacterium OLB4]MBV6399237.1 hypothetical protein [Ignavibacteria bacterium]MCC6884910.1 cupin domain-containing protein [Ignavibacteriales bacterium]MCE7953559.1 cupin domain-containing protein [Chlorobi bacterium CHB7]MDL1887551.1 cupin domain-containing protein [Ignavibacteria bacterium CHB1]MEB2329321.1 cupin domain-containing protein [Ignavibacteriaceae bacterium]OQY78436.1 MAG: